MASPLLHIKDSYYFEIPKSLFPQSFKGKEDFVGAKETWLRLDPDFQAWEADRFYEKYAAIKASPDPKSDLLPKYEEWKHHDHANTGKPFWRFLAEHHDKDWYNAQLKASPSFGKQWHAAIEETSGSRALAEYRSTGPQWSTEKLDAYAKHLSGKILIPQPFGRLRNLYEKEWGVCISKFMIIEVMVALVLWAIFSWLARNVVSGQRPRGAMWNLLEAFVTFVRDEIARPVIGHSPHRLAAAGGADVHGHHDESHAAHKPSRGHEHSGHGHAEPQHTGHEQAEHKSHDAGDHEHEHDADPRFDGDRFVPLLLTIFFFVLGCNLSGMIPWLGSPTGVWGTTSAVAIVTFATGLIYGVRRFGLIGYFLNQIPGMEVPWYAAIVLKPMIFAIEILGLVIKHTVLSIRLLANMLAGHMVLLSIMALAFSLEGAASSSWPIAAPVSIIGCTLLSCLELFVAFLQAYIFTFLSAMFIGAAIHHH
jgi:F-type H+-transporting ATPase subunit a